MADIGSTNITTTQIRNALGEDNNNIGLLCKSSKVNPWQGDNVNDYTAGISKSFYVDANKLVQYQNRTTHKMGYFKYYDHNAVKPTVNSYDSGTYKVDPGASYSTHIEVQLSSLKWTEALSYEGVTAFYLICNDLDTNSRQFTEMLDLTLTHNQSQIYDKMLVQGNYEFKTLLGKNDAVTEHIADFPSTTVNSWTLTVEEKEEPVANIVYEAVQDDGINSVSDNGTTITENSDQTTIKITTDISNSRGVKGEILVKRNDGSYTPLTGTVQWDYGVNDYSYNETLPFVVQYDDVIYFKCRKATI